MVRFFIKVSRTTPFWFRSVSASRILGDIGYHPSVPDRLAVLLGIKPRIAVANTACQVNPDCLRSADKIGEGTLK